MIKKNAIGRFCYVQKEEGSACSGIVPRGEKPADPCHALFQKWASVAVGKRKVQVALTAQRTEICLIQGTFSFVVNGTVVITD